MRLLLKLAIPTAAENAIVGEPRFSERLNGLFRELGALAIFSRRSEGRVIAYALFDIADPVRIFAIAEPISRWLKVKPEFLHETVGKSYFGDVTLPERHQKPSPDPDPLPRP
jgi:hypothetical protein